MCSSDLINKKTNSNIFILEKKFALPVQRVIKNTPIENLKSKPFILKKKFSIIENKKENKNNVFDLNKNKIEGIFN